MSTYNMYIEDHAQFNGSKINSSRKLFEYSSEYGENYHFVRFGVAQNINQWRIEAVLHRYLPENRKCVQK